MVPNLKETSENNTSFNQGLFQYKKEPLKNKYFFFLNIKNE